MTVLSLDLSTKSSGWAIFIDKKLESYGCITASSTDVIKRIQKIIDELKIEMNKYKIDKIIVEEVRPEGNGTNQRTHKVLMWMQAALEFMVHDNFKNIPIEYIVPSSWRAKCGIKNGRGVRRDSVKQYDINFVKETYGIEVNDDIADAIGIGHSEVNKINNELNWE